jgi:dihydrofolate reductase
LKLHGATGRAVDGTHDADVMLFGRVTYEELRRRLAGTGGRQRRTRRLGDVPQDRRTTRRIALSGSVSVVRQLLDAGLLHELHLLVHPATPARVHRAIAPSI